MSCKTFLAKNSIPGKGAQNASVFVMFVYLFVKLIALLIIKSQL